MDPRTVAFSVVLGGLLWLTVAGPGTRTVSAQGKGFVEGGGLLDVDPTQRSQTTTTSGVTIGAGVFKTPRFSMQLEFELPDWHASEYAGRGRVASHIEAYAQREKRRSPSVSMLFGYNIRPVTRLTIALLAGGTFPCRSPDVHAAGRRILQILRDGNRPAATRQSRTKGSVPSGIRTRVTGVKGRRPGPLDDGDTEGVLRGPD